MDVAGFSEQDRTHRQRLLPGFDQDRVAAGRVLVVGAGGLGCPVVQALAAAGVGFIRLVDPDVVSWSNLQRQVLFSAADVNSPKVAVAAEKARGLQPSITVEPVQEFFDASTAFSLLDGVDVVVDCTDSFAAKYVVADACEITATPLVWGTVLRFEGQLSLFHRGAHLRDVFPTLPDVREDCATAGVLGATTAVVGSLMATEVLKFFSGLPTIEGMLVRYDALTGSCSRFGVLRDPARSPAVNLDSHRIPDVRVDVRELEERNSQLKFSDSVHLPLSTLTHTQVEELCATYRGCTVGVFCASGFRAAQFVRQWADVARSFDVVLKVL
ncbi:MAG: ThiF family adenylyltransferase [Corynebacterium sp.]|uniref:ThiF family adenylyltransferase n=1 Tax=Corynebacterium sp. TaxID=1720 RepID=UPI0026DD50A9|nr:ThiF family adenylyltransferase [Corynebacterium sp.]MDO4762293.1 ThiF family adenylyltransferase [Corynebacterium sp.]